MDERTRARKQNMKIYPLYRAISFDLIFYYAIEFLFLTQVKNISGSDIVLGGAFYAIFMILLQIPVSVLVDKIGTKKCTIAANIFNSIFVILIISCENLGTLIFAQRSIRQCINTIFYSRSKKTRGNIFQIRRKRRQRLLPIKCYHLHMFRIFIYH